MISSSTSCKKNFPAKLFEILSDEENSDIISWMPHGRGWKVHDSKRFELEIIPKHFKLTKFSSFTRQVNAWGFRKVSNGVDKGCFYHEFFLKNHANLVAKISRPKKKIGEDPFYKLHKDQGREHQDKQHYQTKIYAADVIPSNEQAPTSPLFVERTPTTTALTLPNARFVGVQRDVSRTSDYPWLVQKQQRQMNGSTIIPLVGSNRRDLIPSHYIHAVPSSSRPCISTIDSIDLSLLLQKQKLDNEIRLRRQAIDGRLAYLKQNHYVVSQVQQGGLI